MQQRMKHDPDNYAKEITCKGMNCIELSAGGYRAIIAPEIGSNVLRLHHTPTNVEIFRWSDTVTGEEIKQATEIWGLPSLYLPNRHDAGILKTSDGEYHFPINEPDLNNYIHGFVHRRCHEVLDMYAVGGIARLKTRYVYDERDEMFRYFPLKFVYELAFTLSPEGLRHEVKITNLSDKALPISFATHTTIQAPFVPTSKQESIRLTVPALMRCELNERCLPTERYTELTDSDFDYFAGRKCPVLQDISNEMYTVCSTILDEEPFYGAFAEDIETDTFIGMEVSPEYRFWIVWNDRGFKGYFCPEPMTAMINAANLSLPPEETGYRELSHGESFTAWQRFFVD